MHSSPPANDDWLSRFDGPLAPLAELVPRLRDDSERLTAGGIELLHRPEVAPEWFRARLWAPLPPAAWRRHESLHGYTIPAAYEAVLAQLNGAYIFECALYGMPSSMLRDPPLLDRSTSAPFDLGTANRHWKREFAAPESWFHFGGGTWTRSANIGYFLDDEGAVRGLVGQVGEVRRWPDFAGFLAAELARAEAAIHDYEAWFAEVRKNSLRPLARLRHRLRRLFGR